jgi:hypothetical protein
LYLCRTTGHSPRRTSKDSAIASPTALRELEANLRPARIAKAIKPTTWNDSFRRVLFS